MTNNYVIKGTPVTEEQILTWSSEAETGIDVAALKKRGRGRPGRGSSTSQIIAVRLTVEELALLDAKAGKKQMSRSEFIREALRQL